MDIDTSNDHTPSSICAAGRKKPSLSSSSVDNCASDELPTSIDGTIRCMGQGECYSSEFEFDGERVKHCNFMMSNDE